MNNIVRKVMRDENGAAMLLAVILLLVGGLVVASLLSFVGTGLRIGPVYEGRVAELYGADAGVEDAVWKIQHQVVKLCPGAPDWPPYSIIVNNRTVEVNISSFYGVGNTTLTYRVASTATGNEAGTEVEAYVTGTPFDYSDITDYILCSQGDIDWGNKVTLCYTAGHAPEDYYGGLWPPAQLLKSFYWQDVKGQTPYADSIIDLNGANMTKGPLYRDGTLEIKNSSQTPAILTLNGTVYVTRDTLIGQNGKDTLTLDLNGQTIFVESSSASAMIVGGKCTIKGPGCIIAVGDVYFAPKGDVGANGKPVFILSVSGTTKLQPSGDYYGAIAGSIWVDVQQGKTPTVYYPPAGFGDSDLNFPGFGDFQLLTYSIASWQVTPLPPNQ